MCIQNILKQLLLNSLPCVIILCFSVLLLCFGKYCHNYSGFSVAYQSNVVSLSYVGLNNVNNIHQICKIAKTLQKCLQTQIYIIIFLNLSETLSAFYHIQKNFMLMSANILYKSTAIFIGHMATNFNHFEYFFISYFSSYSTDFWICHKNINLS